MILSVWLHVVAYIFICFAPCKTWITIDYAAAAQDAADRLAPPLQLDMSADSEALLPASKTDV
jgi:hypothetical protein